MNLTDDADDSLYCFPQLRESCLKADRHPFTRAIMYTFMLAIILVTVFGNLLVIMSISHFRQLQSPTNFIILSLALVDCLLGCLVLPYSMMRSVEGCWYLGETVCTLHSSLDMGLSVASLLHVCLISADRYWAICYPFRYGGNSTVLFVAFGTSITWLFSIILSFGVLFSKVNLLGVETVFLNLCVGACVLMFNKEWGIIAPIVTFFLPAAVMVSLYLKIFYVARRHAQSISDRHGVDASPQISDQKERKAAKTLSFVVGVFVLCWMPYFITTIMDPFLNFSAPTGVFDALGWFGYFNSTCNPLIYGFFYPRFQKAFKMIMSRLIFKHGFLNKTFDAA